MLVHDRFLVHREMFVPLSHPPGHAQADFGEADVIIAGVEYRAHYFVMTLPHSDAYFLWAVIGKKVMDVLNVMDSVLRETLPEILRNTDLLRTNIRPNHIDI